jgi:peptidoglycan/xylan/chitin deacetylase (PgdA/CDA1 family)
VSSPAWPGGRRSAVAFTFDFDAEEVWIGEDPANASRPGVLSQGAYGAKVGLPLVLEALERHGVKATVFVPGRTVERHPARVREVVEAGHELGHHGYTHTHPGRLSAEDEEREFVRAREILAAYGTPVTGYRSPAWDFSAATMGILERHGIVYSSNLMDDIRPYRHPGGVVELPVQWLLDDAPHFWFSNASWTKGIQSPRHVLELWLAELEGVHRLGGLTVFTMHPQIIGRPSRLAMLEQLLADVSARSDVWIATCAEIAAWTRGR